jgi:DNA polymerase-1
MRTCGPCSAPARTFIRLSGMQVDGGPITVSTDLPTVAQTVNTAATVIGHNLMGYDLIALARHAGLDVVELANQGRVLDTKILAMLADPPPAKMNTAQAEKHYSLNSVGDRLLGETKHGDLKALAKEFGGYDKIPTDDPRYVEYLHGDVSITSQLAEVLPVDEYAMREHRVAALGAQMTLSGFRVDVDLLRQRFEAGENRRQELVGWLRAEHGLPTLKKDGKPSAAPQATLEGKAAIEAAFVAAGLDEELIPRTATGAMKLDQTTLTELIETYEDDIPGIVDVVEAVSSLNGIRTIYGTTLAHLVGDKVHPTVNMGQSTGRWSIQDPGLTVFGKRGGKAVERAILLPDAEDHVLISADLSQIDARAVAAWSQDPNYMALFEPGRDMHTEVAIAVFGDASFRETAKPLSHGSNYGLGLERLPQAQPQGRPGARGQVLRDDAGAVPAGRGVEEPGPLRGRVRRAARQRVRPKAAGRPGPGLHRGPGGRRSGDRSGPADGGPARLPLDVAAMVRAVVHDEVVLSVPIADVDEVERVVLKALSFEWAPPGKSRPIQVEAGLGGRGLDWAGCYNAGRVASEDVKST